MAQRWAAMLLVHAWAASTLLAAAESPASPSSAPGVINGEDMTRVRAVEAWLDKGGPPPQSWEVKTKADVSIGKELARGRSKCVRHGRLGTRKVVVVAVCPVSNSSAFAGHNYKELHAAGEALKRRHHLVEEMYFLEVLRGRPGIPTLRGAFLENGDLSIVVDDCGARITGVDHKKQPIASDAWRAFAKRDPLGAARRYWKYSEVWSTTAATSSRTSRPISSRSTGTSCTSSTARTSRWTGRWPRSSGAARALPCAAINPWMARDGEPPRVRTRCPPFPCRRPAARRARRCGRASRADRRAAALIPAPAPRRRPGEISATSTRRA